MKIEIKNLEASYGERPILSDVDLKVPEGKITMLIGKNGCGKSTLLKCIAGVLPVKKGDICIDGQKISEISKKEIAKKLAFLPQSPLVPDGITVKELVSYGRFPYQKPFVGFTKEDGKIIEWAMEKTGVTGWKDSLVKELSGGQRQRVWIALALAQKTGILLLDEPTTYLDMAHQLEILELLQRLNREEGTTIVAVIHELNHAAKFAGHIVGVKQGNILFAGAPSQVIKKENLRQLYEIDAVLMQEEGKDYPVCTDYSLVKAKQSFRK